MLGNIGGHYLCVGKLEVVIVLSILSLIFVIVISTIISLVIIKKHLQKSKRKPRDCKQKVERGATVHSSEEVMATDTTSKVKTEVSQKNTDSADISLGFTSRYGGSTIIFDERSGSDADANESCAQIIEHNDEYGTLDGDARNSPGKTETNSNLDINQIEAAQQTLSTSQRPLPDRPYFSEKKSNK